MFHSPYALTLALLAAIVAAAWLRREPGLEPLVDSEERAFVQETTGAPPRLFAKPSALSQLPPPRDLASAGLPVEQTLPPSLPAANWAPPPLPSLPAEREPIIPELSLDAPAVNDSETPSSAPAPRTSLPGENEAPASPSARRGSAPALGEAQPPAPEKRAPAPEAALEPLRAPEPTVAEPLAAQPLPRVALQSPAFQAVENQLREMNRRAFQLAERGALFAARAEFLQALHTAAQACDAAAQQRGYSQALAAGLQALKEAADFAPQHRSARGDAGAVAQPHATKLLPQGDISPLVAMQRYLTHAQEKLASASGGSPAAAESLYGLGRIHVWLAGQSETADRLHVPQAMVCQQAALAVHPQHALAANELGVLYARFGQWREARDLFQHSLTAELRPETWRNLAVVHQHLGESELARLADDEHRRLVAARSPSASPTPAGPVEWVQPKTFAAAPREPAVAAGTRSAAAPYATPRR